MPGPGKAAALARQIQAQKRATETVAHDLKQPFAAIDALTQAVLAQEQRGGGPVGSRDLLQLIQQEAKDAVSAINDLLRISTELPLEPQEFNLVGLVSGLATTQSLKSYAHEVEVRASEDDIRVFGDPRYLGKAVDNLIDNAIKYWPEGGVVVVEIARRAGGVSLKVIDRGLGIPAKSQALIFECYERAVPDGVTISGTGIGLYSVKRIVEGHSGNITVESEPGKGSTFTIILPDSLQQTAHDRSGGAAA
jgi:signal transduction histidine kinase